MKTLTVPARERAASRFGRSLTATLLAVMMTAPPIAHASEWADRVFVGGAIVTMDAEGRVVEGLAARDGRIVAVGDEASVRALIGPATVVTELQGKALLPGFIDSHSHYLGVGTTALYEVDLNSPGDRDSPQMRQFAQSCCGPRPRTTLFRRFFLLPPDCPQA